MAVLCLALTVLYVLGSRKIAWSVAAWIRSPTSLSRSATTPPKGKLSTHSKGFYLEAKAVTVLYVPYSLDRAVTVLHVQNLAVTVSHVPYSLDNIGIEGCAWIAAAWKVRPIFLSRSGAPPPCDDPPVTCVRVRL